MFHRAYISKRQPTRTNDPRDTYDTLQWTMIHAHEGIKTGFDNILHLLENVPHDDLQNFLGYCLAWAQLFKEHHDGEEAVVFPFLNQKLDFSKEIEQHKGIHAALATIIATIQLAQAQPARFDAEELKSQLISLRDPMIQHLDDEVADLDPENLKVFSEDGIKKMLADMIAWSKYNGSPFLTLPFMRAHVPPEFKDHWPKMPWFLRKILIPWIFAFPHSGYWKYAPYSV
ncbi:unnamed protein product [Somion occarium]|uniref:Hemerythrin-like domain-containing protein n=1 Tax=Somion occarium TaxID=3059160 RepID=A0ABP1E259_9APHY